MPRKPGSHLTYEERCQISSYLCNGFSQKLTAKMIGRDQSVISRELRRNSVGSVFDARQGQNNAELRRSVASSRPKAGTAETLGRALELLRTIQASPEQISGRLRIFEGLHISHETIYKFIWSDKRAGGNFYKHLRHKTKKYNKRSGKNAGRGLIPNRVGIELRPAIVEDKSRFGDIELDTIVGANHKGAVVSMVDRSTKFSWFSLVPAGTAINVENAICEKLLSLSEQNLVKTLTSDNGKEFANHESITQKLGGNFYFATPYHSWERGLNEHTNGLFRQYYPKGTDFKNISQEDVIGVANKLNNRPRKILGYLTPAESMSAMLHRQLDGIPAAV